MESKKLTTEEVLEWIKSNRTNSMKSILSNEMLDEALDYPVDTIGVFVDLKSLDEKTLTFWHRTLGSEYFAKVSLTISGGAFPTSWGWLIFYSPKSFLIVKGINGECTYFRNKQNPLGEIYWEKCEDVFDTEDSNKYCGAFFTTYSDKETEAMVENMYFNMMSKPSEEVIVS